MRLGDFYKRIREDYTPLEPFREFRPTVFNMNNFKGRANAIFNNMGAKGNSARYGYNAPFKWYAYFEKMFPLMVVVMKMPAQGAEDKTVVIDAVDFYAYLREQEKKTVAVKAFFDFMKKRGCDRVVVNEWNSGFHDKSGVQEVEGIMDKVFGEVGTRTGEDEMTWDINGGVVEGYQAPEFFNGLTPEAELKLVKDKYLGVRRNDRGAAFVAMYSKVSVDKARGTVKGCELYEMTKVPDSGIPVVTLSTANHWKYEPAGRVEEWLEKGYIFPKEQKPAEEEPKAEEPVKAPEVPGKPAEEPVVEKPVEPVVEEPKAEAGSGDGSITIDGFNMGTTLGFKLTRSYVQEVYDEFNRKYFNGECPDDIKIKFVNRDMRRLGCCRWNHATECPDKDWTLVALEITTRYAISEYSVCTTILHEMVHIYDTKVLGDNEFESEGGHGPLFMSQCDRLGKYGWELGRFAARWQTIERKEGGVTPEVAERFLKNNCLVVYQEDDDYCLVTCPKSARRRAFSWVSNPKFYGMKDMSLKKKVPGTTFSGRSFHYYTIDEYELRDLLDNGIIYPLD